MRRLVLLGGPPGVGKSTILKLLAGRFQKFGALDADDVWRVSDDMIGGDRGRFAITNVTSVMRGYFEAGCELGILSWVFARAELYQPVLDSLADVVDRSLIIHLVASPGTLERRLVARGEGEKTAYAMSRLELILQLPFTRIDTSDISPATAADRVAAALFDWGAQDA
jgi:energy-coupling factor transporter ATP-binding protein EcfA2